MQPLDHSTIITRAALAPSVHNTQPARWRITDEGLLLACDPATILTAGDPEGRDAGLSCGAALEAAVLALSAQGYSAHVTDLWPQNDTTSIPGYRLAATLRFGAAVRPDPLERLLDSRFTFRAAFLPAIPDMWRGWTPDDAVLLTDAVDKEWIAALNDLISLQTLRQTPVRQELLQWMRLSRRHPRYAYDGMNRAALRMSGPTAFAAGLTLGPLWPLCDRLGLTPAMTAEARNTTSAAVIAAFHRPAGESPVTTGRAYLRLCLAAAHCGFAGWPMAALADDPATRATIAARLGIGPDRRLIQMIRFGIPSGPMRPRARRPVTEVMI
jgi:hypothetical protein